MSQRVVILGGGESGVGAARLALQQGFDVFVSDRGSISPKYAAMLNQMDLSWEDGKHTSDEIYRADIVVKSPGIPDTIPLILKYHELGIPVISEIEFAARYTSAKIIAVTGSNGKTTTVSLLGHILKQAGVNVAVGGNIGDSFAALVCEDNFDWYVLELSSFQLDGIREFRPDIAILTNISPDHLDRYDYKFENYAASKMRLGMNQRTSDSFIYSANDVASKNAMLDHPINSKLVSFAIEAEDVNTKARVSDGEMLIQAEGSHALQLHVDDLALSGQHNQKNAMAAALAAQLAGVRNEDIKNALKNFKAVNHRMEKVGVLNGVSYINDSKATNVDAVWYALESQKAKVIWIAGGVDKGNDYSALEELVGDKVKALICLGKENQKLKQAFSKLVDPITEVDSMPGAVRLAKEYSEPGDTVLLSPACASFDLFNSYEDRGNQFRDEITKMSSKDNA